MRLHSLVLGIITLALNVWIFIAWEPPDGVNCALWPAVAAAVVGYAAKYKGTKRPKGDFFKPSKAFLREHERFQMGDVRKLYGRQPYEGPGLGFTPAVMEGRFGLRGAEFASARAGEEQTIRDYYRGAGAPRRMGGSYFRSMQRARQSDLARRSANRRQMMISNALQRRADLTTRMGAAGSALGQGAGIFNRAASLQYAAALEQAKTRGEFYTGLGSAVLAAGGKKKDPKS